MKKISAILITIVFVMGLFINVHAESDKVFRIQSLGIMIGDENGDFHEEKTITRAEFSQILVRILNFEDISYQEEIGSFTDVSKEHWAYDCIETIYRMGIITGIGNNMFAPEKPITLDEASKMIVSALGYDIMAQQKGGYPTGYLAAATQLGLLKNVEGETKPLSRLAVASILYNALDVVPLEIIYGSGTYEKNTENHTLLDLYMQKKDLVEVEGILTQNKYMSIENESYKQEEDEIINIDDLQSSLPGNKYNGIKYDSKRDYSEYIGCYVKGYAEYNDYNGKFRIVDLTPIEHKNKITEVDAEDAYMHSGYIEYMNDNDRKEKASFEDDVTYVYNGRVTDDASVYGKKVFYGQYRLVDNSGNGKIDIVFINEAESFVIERINERSMAVYFADRQTYRNKNNLIFDEEDDEKVYLIENADGERIDFNDITVNNSITFYSSINGEYVKAIVSDKQIEGDVTSIGQDGEITVNDIELECANKADGTSVLAPSLSDSGIFFIDYLGKIVGFVENGDSEYVFGYVMNAGSKSRFSGLEIEVLIGSEPEKEVKVKSGVETISYYFRNKESNIYQLNSKVKFNGSNSNGKNLQSEQVNGKLVSFKLNAEGLVKELNTYDIPTVFRNHTFNADILSFGGLNLTRGYLTDKNTQIICIPETIRNEDDFFVQVKLADGSTANKVFGVNAFPLQNSNIAEEAQPVDVLVIVSEMNSQKPSPIDEDADVCIVGDVRHVMSKLEVDEDEWVCQIELLNGNQLLTEVTASTGKAYQIAQNLKKGDLIRYNKDGYGRIMNMEVLDSVQGLTEFGQTTSGGLYGLAEEVKYNVYDYQLNAMIDDLTLYYDEYKDREFVKILREDGPQVYLYDRATGWISPATTDDIITFSSKVYVYMKDNEAQTVVVIND